MDLPFWKGCKRNWIECSRKGASNAYFHIYSKSYFSREASHVDGFAKECAVVTHYRLMNDEDGKGIVVDPEAKLEEELIVRPT